MAANRVSAKEVKDILTTSISDGTLQSSFIDTAHVYVDDHLVGSTLSAAMLAKIELYLSAHFVALTEERGGLVESELGEARDRYSDVYEGGLKSTRYGLMALSLDTTGILTSISTVALKAQFRVV